MSSDSEDREQKVQQPVQRALEVEPSDKNGVGHGAETASPETVAGGPQVAAVDAGQPPYQPEPGDVARADVANDLPPPAPGSGEKICRGCGTTNPADADRCASCGTWLPGNAAAVKTGLYRQQPPADLRLTSDELIAGIVSDLGGESELSTLEKAYVRNLGDVTVVLRLLLNDLVSRSVFTPGGNPRKTFDAYLSAIDRFDRLGQRVGMKRRPRHVPSLDEVMDGDE